MSFEPREDGMLPNEPRAGARSPLPAGDLIRPHAGPVSRPLGGRVALVAGATRGAGCGIACALGEAGATVYCSGRSVRGRPAMEGRPETVEETAEQVEALVDRIRREEGRLDLLVNDVWGGHPLTEWGKPFSPTWTAGGRTGCGTSARPSPRS